MLYTYILKSEVDGKTYVGHTKNLKLRFEQHNNGKVPSTKNRKPLELIYYEACLCRDDALKREKYLKTHYGKMFMKKSLQRGSQRMNNSHGSNFISWGKESQSASSRADFKNKINISLKEMRESNYWLRIISAISNESEEIKYLIRESEELKKILGSIVSKVSKNNL